MTMARYVNGPRSAVQNVPTANVNAGDVIVYESLTYVSDLDNPVGIGLSIIQLAVYIGGIYKVLADGAYQVGTYVYWNPTTQQVGETGTVPFGWIVAGPLGLASDGGPTGAAISCFVLHDPQSAPTLQLTIGATAADTVTNTNTETAFVTTATIPAGTLQVGDVIHIRTAVEVTAQNSTNTNDLKLKIETAANTFTTVTNTGAINAAANAVAIVDVDLVFTAVGNTGAFYAMGVQAFGAQGTATLSPVALANTAINTALPIVIEVTDTQSAASAGNVAQLMLMDASIKRK